MSLSATVKQRIVSELQANGQNVSHTAKALGLSRRSFYRLLDKYGLRAAKRHVMTGEPKEKHRASGIVARAIEKGLEVHPCEVCGSTEGLEAHHEDYSKPLAVKWLCRKHHRRLHATRREAFTDARLVRTFLEWPSLSC